MQIGAGETSSQNQNEFDELFFEAQRLKAVGDIEKAIVQFKRCLEFDPTNVSVNYELAHYYIENHLPAEARPYLEAAVAGDPDNLYIAEEQWKYAKQEFDIVAEREALLKLRALEPSNPEYLWELAMVRLEEGDIEGGIADLDELEVLMGPNDALTDQRVRIQLEVGDYAGAEQSLVHAIALSPNRVELRGRLAEFYQNYGDPNKAIGVYEEIIRIDPLEPRSNLHLAEFLYKSGRVDSSRHHLRIAMGSSRLEIDPKVGVMGIFMQMADQDPSVLPFAFEMLDTIIAVHPEDPKAYALKADFTVRAGKLELSRTLWKKAVSLPEGNLWMMWEQILQMDVELQWWDSLHVDAQLVIERFPNRPAGYLTDGSALIQLGEYEDAIAIMEEGELYALGNPELSAQYFLQFATAYQRNGDSYSAYDYLDRVLRQNPDHPLALNNYAYYLALEKVRLNEAETMIAKATRLVPNEFRFWDTYAMVLYLQGRSSEALEKIQLAIEFGGVGSASVLEHKADILVDLKRVPEAIDIYKSAIRAGGDEQRIEQKINENK